MTADPRGVEKLDVFQNEVRAGSLHRTAKGCAFEYDDAFFAAHHDLPGGLATTLPFARRRTEVEGDSLPTYFAGLLPEGRRLSALHSRLKTSADDLFTLLVAAGPNCVGDLFPMLPRSRKKPLDEEEQRAELDTLSFSALFAETLETTAPSIAGVQEKLSPSMISFPFATAGRRWLLKLNPPDRERLVENEFFFMNMAKACGLDVPPVHLVKDRDGRSGLLVRRFDRVRVARQWRGIRQEDACQFLDRYPADKYRVTTADIAEQLSVCAAPAVARARLLEQLAFSYLIGNGDLHAKNVSITAPGGITQLSPAYDVICTRPYGDQSLALEFEGRTKNVKRRDFVRFGARFGVLQKAVEARLDRLVESARPFGKRFGELGYDARLTKQISTQFEHRLGDLSA